MVKRDLIRNIILAIIFSLVLFFIGRFYISTVKVTQENENSFLKAGDVLIYTKQTKPKENDFIVYDVDGKTYISRFIAKGEDSVTSMDDVLYVNGKIKSEPYIEKLKSAYLTENNHQMNFTTDFNLRVVNKAMKAKTDKDSYFVLNDNRQDLKDSRTFGVISHAQVRGVLTFKVFPFESFGFIESQ